MSRITKAETNTLIAIAHRVMLVLGTAQESRRWVLGAIMVELATVHTHVVPLDLDALLAAPDEDLIHDVLGIHYHLDGGPPTLKDAFLPRCARQ